MTTTALPPAQPSPSTRDEGDGARDVSALVDLSPPAPARSCPRSRKRSLKESGPLSRLRERVRERADLASGGAGRKTVNVNVNVNDHGGGPVHVHVNDHGGDHVHGNGFRNGWGLAGAATRKACPLPNPPPRTGEGIGRSLGPVNGTAPVVVDVHVNGTAPVIVDVHVDVDVDVDVIVNGQSLG